MADITMPQLGETVTEGTITKWFKAVGDTVAEDEPLFEVSTDKVDSEVPSPISGTLTEIKVPEGDTVDVGVVLAVIGDAGSAPAPAASVATISEPTPVVEPVVEPVSVPDVALVAVVAEVSQSSGLVSCAQGLVVATAPVVGAVVPTVLTFEVV